VRTDFERNHRTHLFGDVPPYKRIRLYEERAGIVLFRPGSPAWPTMTRFIGFSAVLVTRALLIAVPGRDVWFRFLLLRRWGRLGGHIRLGGILDFLHPFYHLVGDATPPAFT